MNLGHLIKGFPGHPTHPPMTDAAIGAYTAATALIVLGAFGVADEALAKGWWITLLVGLAFGAAAALTGFVDWLGISSGTPLKRTATTHMIVMLTATTLFVIAALTGWSGYDDSVIDTAPVVFMLLGFGALALGGWLGGSIVFVHGMRVLSLVDEPAVEASLPGGERKEEAEGG